MAKCGIKPPIQDKVPTHVKGDLTELNLDKFFRFLELLKTIKVAPTSLIIYHFSKANTIRPQD